MIALEPPALAVFARVQPVPDVDMAAEHQSPLATFQAYHIVLADGLPY
jgi:hypothetical protein